MSMGRTTVALVRPVAQFLRRGVSQSVVAPLRHGSTGALVAPTESGSTLTVRRPDGTALVSAAAVAVVSSVATASLAPAAAETLGAGWTLEWSLVVDGEAVVFRESAYLCDYIPHNVISAVELYEAKPELQHHVPPAQETAGQGWQPQIDRAYYDLLQLLLDSGHEPWRLREVVGARRWLEVRALQRCVGAIEHGPASTWAQYAKSLYFEMRAAQAELRLQWEEDAPTHRRGVTGSIRLAPLRRGWR
jgi:hypothetical protein